LGDVRQFAEVSELQREQPDLKLLCAGPWPPYSLARAFHLVCHLRNPLRELPQVRLARVLVDLATREPERRNPCHASDDIFRSPQLTP